MDVRIGIRNAPREVNIEMADDASVEEIKATVEAAVAGSTLAWLVDRKGRQIGFPGAHVAYVEIGAHGDDQRIGFS